MWMKYFILVLVLCSAFSASLEYVGDELYPTETKFFGIDDSSVRHRSTFYYESPLSGDVTFNIEGSGIEVIMNASEVIPNSTVASITVLNSSWSRVKFPLNLVIGIIKSNERSNSEVTQKGILTLNSYVLSSLGYIFIYAYSHATNSTTYFPLGLHYTYDITNDFTLMDFQDEIVSNISHDCVELSDDKQWIQQNSPRTQRIEQNIHCYTEIDKPTLFGIRETITIFVVTKPVTVIRILCNIFVGFSNAVLMLSITLLLTIRKQLLRHRVFMQIGIAFSFLGEGTASFLDQFLANLGSFYPGPCKATAVLYIYFSLTSACWVLNEGVILFIKIGLAAYVDYKKVVAAKRMIVVTICTWVLPGIVVGMSCASEILADTFLHVSELYVTVSEKNENLEKHESGISLPISKIRKYNLCWASDESSGFNFTSFPIVIILFLNVIISLYVLVVTMRMAYKDDKTRPAHCGQPHNNAMVTTTAKAVFVLTWSLGTPNIVTYLMVKHNFGLEALAARTALMVFQGPIVFYFYCWKNPDVRNAWRRWRDREKLFSC